MGQIYPELSRACYAASQHEANITDIFIELSTKIKQLQNTHGEVPAIDKKNKWTQNDSPVLNIKLR